MSQPAPPSTEANMDDQKREQVRQQIDALPRLDKLHELIEELQGALYDVGVQLGRIGDDIAKSAGLTCRDWCGTCDKTLFVGDRVAWGSVGFVCSSCAEPGEELLPLEPEDDE